MTVFQWHRDDAGIVTLTMDAPGQSANTMNGAFRADLGAAVERLRGEREAVRGVIVTSAKDSFLAGGDLDELLTFGPEQADAFFASLEQMKGWLRELETFGFPVVAALNGTALGGGWEIALACHHRIAIDSPRSRFGLPEVTLGLMPGAGGVTRMVRLLGLQEAMPYLMEGKQVKPADALKAGLVQDLAVDAADMMAKARAWIAANPAPRQPWDRDDYRMPGGLPSSPKVAGLLTVAPAMLRDKTKGCYPAPEAILASAVEGARVAFDTACRIESRYMTSLTVGPVAKNMITAFWQQMRALKSGVSRPAGVPSWRAAQVGVLGAGMMGSGIAYAAASKGLPVVLKDVSLEAAEKGKGYSRALLEKSVERGRLTTEAMDKTLGLIRPTVDAADLAGCDLIIEAVFESVELKARVTAEAEALLGPNAIMASNTSTLPISKLADASKRPANFIGLHFFSPVDKMQLVEIVVGRQTSPETLARAFDFVLQIGKLPIVVNDSRGFFTSRVFTAFVMEGIAMLGEGRPPAAIENAALMAGMPVGPLAISDEISLSLYAAIAAQNKAGVEAEGGVYVRHPGEDVVERMVGEFRRPGKAAGAGFYEYPKDGRKHLWPGLAQHYPVAAEESPFDDLRDRILYIQAIEAVRCYEEGVLRSVGDANLGSIFGIGFPGWTGGVLQFINHVGPAAFVARARQLAERYGRRFEPPQRLIEMAETGARFTNEAA